MKVIDTTFEDVKIIEFDAFGDDRGLFAETWSENYLEQLQETPIWVQDSFSISNNKGTVRGLHFQTPPAGQIKLVRPVKGSIFDVVLDVRHGSPTFGQHYSVVLSAGDRRQLLVPPSYAHGFCTLEDHTEIFYKLSGFYSPENYLGVFWNDPALGIDWPVKPEDAILSDKDQLLPPLADLPPVFVG